MIISKKNDNKEISIYSCKSQNFNWILMQYYVKYILI